MKARQANKIIKKILLVTEFGPISPLWVRINIQKRECKTYTMNQMRAAIHVFCRNTAFANDYKTLCEFTGIKP